ncbi:MAG: ABC transporter permease [Planctomycetota bacterium]
MSAANDPAPRADWDGGELPVVVIEPRKGWLMIDWRELWAYRDLWLTLAARDIKVRYKQTVLGGFWAILRPFLTMVIFTFIFQRMGRLSTDGLPGPVFYYAGLLPWTFFAAVVTGASQSLIEGARLMTKVYFPRILIPSCVLGYALIDLALAALVFLPILWYYGVAPSREAVFLPLLAGGIVLTALGVGVLLAALNVKYRDFRYVVPFLVQIWMFLSNVVTPASIIPKRYERLMSLNPMAGLIEGFRNALVGRPLAWDAIGISLGVGLFLFFFGVAYFRNVEDEFADIV